MKLLKIIVIVDSIDVNESSGSKANVSFINNLVKAGFKITVYHYSRKEIKLNGVDCKSIKEKKASVFYFLSRLQRVIQRTLKVNWAKYLESIFGFSFTFLNDVSSITAELKKIDISKFNLVLTLSQAASFRPHFAINKLPELHDKWMAYIHDPYPFSKYPYPYDWKEPGHKTKEQFFHSLSINAKYSVFPSLLLQEFMSTHFSNFSDTGIVIPHQISDLNIEEQKNLNYFEQDKFNILHAGSLLKQRNPVGLIEGFQLFLDSNPNAKKSSKLMLLGSADYHKVIIDDYSQKINQLYTNLSNVSFNEVFWLQNHVSVNVILEANSELSPFLPGKFPHCVSANKLIIHLGPEKSETIRLLGEDYPYGCEIDNAYKISTIIEKLYKDWLKQDKILKLNRPDLEHYLGVEYLKEQLIKIISND